MMSNDLIRRQDAIYIIQRLYPGIPRVKLLQKKWQKRYEPYIRVENAIRELPSAQKEGEWIKIKFDDSTVCSNCGLVLEDWIQGIFYNFCPRCGSRMRKGEQQ